MKRTRMPPRTAPLPRSAIKRKPRKAAEFARIYHSRARVAFVKSLPCVACGEFATDVLGREMDNMHIRGDGTGRKAGYEFIVPCHRVHHEEAHHIGIENFASRYNVDLALAAIATEQQWLAHCARA